MAKKKGEPFEAALKRLQSIVEKMERGDLPLEDAVEAYTEGIRLVQVCHQKLEEAENRVQVLLKDQQGGWSATPLDGSSGESENTSE
jgi:exodeoxyribonuclease VII small subunit